MMMGTGCGMACFVARSGRCSVRSGGESALAGGSTGVVTSRRDGQVVDVSHSMWCSGEEMRRDGRSSMKILVVRCCFSGSSVAALFVVDGTGTSQPRRTRHVRDVAAVRRMFTLQPASNLIKAQAQRGGQCAVITTLGGTQPILLSRRMHHG
jgi:hypothetical protein